MVFRQKVKKRINKNKPKTTALIVSFGRPLYAIDCVNTLSQCFNIEILVGENGKPSKELEKVVNQAGGRYIVLPFDCGVPHVRNVLFKKIKTPYVLIGDDDFYYIPEANIDRAEKFLDNNEKYSIIGGRVREKHVIKDWQGYIHADNGYFYDKIPASKLYYKFCPESQFHYCPVDMMTNFWVGRLKDLPEYLEDQKIAHEHFDYMMRMLDKVNMAFTPDMFVDHKKRFYHYDNYKKYRFRSEEMNYIKDKYGDTTTQNPL